MGYMKHHAIIVSGMKGSTDEAFRVANSFGMTLIGPSEEVTNGYTSFMVCPDGSKEGWDESDASDVRRDRFVTWLREAPLRRCWVAWVEVQYGDDDVQTLIVRHSDEACEGGRDGVS